ncbi:MAG: hypothetical protein HYZ42_10975 [Bacteroidetes bacterium]|nr:hypothetical protein [Bacteroidota bacterium]
MIQKPIIEEVPTITETNNNADLRFSSSKVILLPRQQTEVKEPEVVQEESIPHKEFTEEQVRMYSSKSATIVEPFLIDSAFKAFLEQEKKSKNKKKK